MFITLRETWPRNSMLDIVNFEMARQIVVCNSPL